MDTKWRKFSTSIVTKIIAFLLSVAAITAAVLQIPLANRKEIDSECIWMKDYVNSDAYSLELVDAFQQVEHIKYTQKLITDVPFVYYITNGEWEISNVGYSIKEEYSKSGSEYYNLSNGEWTEVQTGNVMISSSYYKKDLTAYLAFPVAYLDQKQQVWNQNRKELTYNIIAGSCLGFLGILLLIYLLCVAGRTAKENKIHLNKFDKLYTDLNLLLLGITISYVWNSSNDIFSDNIRIGIRFSKYGAKFSMDFLNNVFLSSILFCTIISLFSIVVIVLVLSLVRLAKASMLIKHSLLYLILNGIYKALNEIYQYIFYKKIYPNASMTEKLYCRQLIMTVLTVIMLPLSVVLGNVLFLAGFIPIAVEVVTIVWYVRGNKKLYTNIDQGLLESMEEQMKSERMKVALITNVSHDLKTPLTSIISYTDLLAKEEGLSDTATDYVKILQAKSGRLKNIVTDLFDLAKSTSGDIALEFDIIDLKKLLEQTLAEMGDKIDQSGLQFKVKLPDNSVNIRSDGKRLYRVFQNVIDNTLKYSMKDSRVYIELEMKEKKAITTIKNVSAYEMNFTEDEILQRFYRGDASRTEEGSGLGLSIAQSFTNNCKGEFKIDIDGDLFKVILTFDLVKEVTDVS